MSLATSNRDGGRTSEAGHLRALLKGLKGQVETGLAVSQRGAGANMSVDVSIGDAMIPRSDGTYGHPAWADAITNVVITTADVSNPRRDIVVMYIDYAVTPSTGVSNNTNGVVKLVVIAGTPAGSPADPSNAAIQSAVGASNPYIKLARVRVAAGATSITNSVIDDLRIMAQGILQAGWTYDDLYTWAFVSSLSFAIAGVDVRSQFPLGTKIALYQGGSIKYFVVTATAFSTNTTVTVVSAGGNTSYTITNVPIDRPAFSYEATPTGFPGVTRRVVMPMQADGSGGAAATHNLGSPEVSLTGTPSGFVRGQANLPKDYAGGDVRIILVMFSDQTQSKSGVYYLNSKALGASFSPLWNVASAVGTGTLAFTANLSREATMTIPAASVAADNHLAFAWNINQAISGTIWVISCMIEYNAQS